MLVLRDLLANPTVLRKISHVFDTLVCLKLAAGAIHEPCSQF